MCVQPNTDSNMNSDDMDGSSFSSFYSSFIKTTDGSDSPQEQDNKETKTTNYQVKPYIIRVIRLINTLLSY